MYNSLMQITEPNMTNVIGCKIPSVKFDWNPTSKEFVAEMSMLSHGGCNPTGQLYNDACDQGFVMVSDKTGKEIPFYLSDTQRDADHDVKFWEFKPSTNSVRINPSLEGVTVIVLND